MSLHVHYVGHNVVYQYIFHMGLHFYIALTCTLQVLGDSGLILTVIVGS